MVSDKPYSITSVREIAQIPVVTLQKAPIDAIVLTLEALVWR